MNSPSSEHWTGRIIKQNSKSKSNGQEKWNKIENEISSNCKWLLEVWTVIALGFEGVGSGWEVFASVSDGTR